MTLFTYLRFVSGSLSSPRQWGCLRSTLATSSSAVLFCIIYASVTVLVMMIMSKLMTTQKMTFQKWIMITTMSISIAGINNPEVLFLTWILRAPIFELQDEVLVSLMLSHRHFGHFCFLLSFFEGEFRSKWLMNGPCSWVATSKMSSLALLLEGKIILPCTLRTFTAGDFFAEDFEYYMYFVHLIHDHRFGSCFCLLVFFILQWT